MLYGGLLIDEWAIYDTFNSESHNWFANQIGISRLIYLWVKNNVKQEIFKGLQN